MYGHRSVGWIIHTVVNAQVQLRVSLLPGLRGTLTHLRSLLLLLLGTFPKDHVRIPPLPGSHVHVEIIWLDGKGLLDLELIIRVVRSHVETLEDLLRQVTSTFKRGGAYHSDYKKRLLPCKWTTYTAPNPITKWLPAIRW
jgi:hypothetical protein